MVISNFIAYLRRTGSTHLCKWLWYGVGAGVALSGIIGIALTIVYYTRDVAKFPGQTKEYFEAVAFIIAAALLTWIILWVMRMGNNLRGKLESDLDHTIDKDPGRKKWAVFVLIFVQCFREGLDTFQFLFGAQASDSGPVIASNGWKGIIIPGLLGLIVSAGIAYFVFRGLLNFDIQYILILSSTIDMFFAAGLTTGALHELRERMLSENSSLAIT
jgi:high-affinity iron transporter